MAELSPDSGNEAFLAAMAPTVAVLDRLADAYLDATLRGGAHPAAHSRAMAELADEERFRRGPWAEPVVDAHSSLRILTFAGVDHMRAYAHLFTSPPVPVYAHFATARAAVEAFAWARWLADPSISVDTRVMRNTA